MEFAQKVTFKNQISSIFYELKVFRKNFKNWNRRFPDHFHKIHFEGSYLTSGMKVMVYSK